jgi:NADH-quinone oxidoreductase subunit M
MRFFLAVLCALAVLALAPTALAKHRIVLSVPGQAHGPLVLSPKESGYVGEFTVSNIGDEPLVVSRIAIRGDDDDVRAPARLSVRFVEGGATTLTIPQGQSRRVNVMWLPDREGRMKQVFAHVVVTSSDEVAGEVAVGVTAQVPRGVPFIADHALSWLVFLPLLGMLACLVTHVMGRRDDQTLRWIALGVTGAQCLIVVWLLAHFNADVTRTDGNDGFQFIEHAVWIRSMQVEYFVGVDGASMPLVALTALLGIVAVIASFHHERQIRGYLTMIFLLLTGVMGVFVALDLVLFFVFWELMLLPLLFLVAVWGGARREQAAAKLFLYALAGSAMLLVAILALAAHADRTFLVDGSSVPRTFSIPELMRVAYTGKKLLLFGLPFVKVVFVLMFVAFAIVMPMVPLHTWMPDALVEAPAPVSALIAGVVVKTGSYAMLRVGFGILPEATRWAAGTLVAFGVVGVIYGALCALAQNDLKRLLAHLVVAHTGFCLVGLGGLTPQGIAGCLMEMFCGGTVAAMLFLLAGALADRSHTRDIRQLGGLSTEMPLMTAFFGLALMASLGLPGLAGFWGQALALFGAFPTYRALTIACAIGLVLVAGAHLSALERVFFGKLDEAWKKSPYLEPFGGKFPEITSREMAVVAPLAALALLLGVWPVPLLALCSGGVRDLTSLVNPPGPDQIAALLP